MGTSIKMARSRDVIKDKSTRLIKKFSQKEKGKEIVVEYQEYKNNKLMKHRMHNHNNSNCIIRFQRKLRKCQKFSIVLFFSWLLMNADPASSRRQIASMIASRLLTRSILNGAADISQVQNNKNGLNLIEAITLIQALNNNNNRGNDINSIRNELELRKLLATEQSLINSRERSSAQTALTSRQLPVPVPVPGPVPVPVPVPVPGPVAAAAAAIAALVAFVAAALGAAPAAAFVAAFVAFIAALLVVILAIFAAAPQKKKQNPFIKKIIIKKTVLPFVIPIPIPIKKKEKEIVYVHKEHHHHKKHKKEYHHDGEESRTKKSKPVGLDNRDEDIINLKDFKPKATTEPGTDTLKRRNTKQHLDQIENLLKEQEHLQSMVDKVVDTKRMNNLSSDV